jgi:hypothetical protein
MVRSVGALLGLAAVAASACSASAVADVQSAPADVPTSPAKPPTPLAIAAEAAGSRPSEAAQAMDAHPPGGTEPRASTDGDHDADQTASAPRVFAEVPRLWIYREPRVSLHPIGYLRAGTSTEVAHDKVIKGRDCRGGWHEIRPFGFVCTAHGGTFDSQKRYVRAMQTLVPADGAYPYNYALSAGAPMYRRLPAEEESARSERWLGPVGFFRPLPDGHRVHERLATAEGPGEYGPIPFYLEDGGTASRRSGTDPLRRLIPHGSALAYTKVVKHLSRDYLLSADGTVVPADRMRFYRESRFEGMALDTEYRLPLAFILPRARQRYGVGAERQHSGGLGRRADWRVRGVLRLDVAGERAGGSEERYQTLERDANGDIVHVERKDVIVVRDVGPTPTSLGPSGKWIRISITGGTLVAYVGPQPVYATLVSPGAGGVPRPGRDNVRFSTTPVGTFVITFKHKVDDMSPDDGNDRAFWLAEVPHALYFAQPFAIHASYWHEDFGEPASAGCVNVSPIDAKWLFEWSEPVLPADWSAVGVGPQTGSGTKVIIVP